MDIITKIFWVITGIALLISIKKDKNKTFNSMKMAQGLMKNLIGEIVGILLLIGLILTFLPPDIIESFMGKTSVFISTIVSALVGSITLIPGFVAFPLVGSLVDAGFSIVPAIAFLTTLTMVGVVTFPLEKDEFGLKFTVVRNSLSFGFAVVIALVMGVLI